MNNAKVSIIIHANEIDKNAILTIHAVLNNFFFFTVSFQNNKIIRVTDIPTFGKVAYFFKYV